MICFSVHSNEVVAQYNTVKPITYAEFTSDIYPKMKRPVIILFGSNYCQYSRNQMKMLQKILRSSDYINYADFYNVDADIPENYEWLRRIYIDEELSALGTPTWVIFYGTRGDGDDIAFSCAGNLTSNQLSNEIEDVIDWYDSAIGY